MIVRLIETMIDLAVMLYAAVLNFVYVLYVMLHLSKRNKITNYKSANNRLFYDERRHDV